MKVLTKIAMALVIGLTLWGCGKKEDDRISLSIKKINGSVSIPSDSRVSLSELHIASMVGESSVNSSGSFSLDVVDKTNYQLLIVKDTSNNPVLLTYAGSQGNVAVSPETTAMSLVTMHPIFWGMYRQYFTQIQSSIKSHPSFEVLKQYIETILVQSDYKLDSYLNYDTPVITLINEIALDVAKQVFPQIQTQSINPLGTPSVPTSCEFPCISNAKTSGKNVAMINPTHVYYGGGVYKTNNEVVDIRVLDKVSGLTEDIWNFITGGYKSEELSLGSGTYNILISKKINFDPNRPEGLATIQNTVFLLTQIFSVFLDLAFGGGSPNDTIAGFVAKAGACLINGKVRISLNYENRIKSALDNGDLVGYFMANAYIGPDEFEPLFSCAIKGLVDTSIKESIKMVAGLALNVVSGGLTSTIAVGYRFINYLIPWGWDYVFKPHELSYNITVSNNQLSDVTPSKIPPYITVSSDAEWTKVNGEAITLTAQASDIDGVITNYQWTADGGSIQSSGDTATWSPPSTSGLYTITVEVTDDDNLKVRASKQLRAVSEDKINIGMQVILTWDVGPYTDVDLHVIDPNGERVYFEHMRSAIGGWLDIDDVDGYGPETFTLPNPISGTYYIKVNFYDDEGAIGQPVYPSVTITLNKGTVFEVSKNYGPYMLTVADHNGTDPNAWWDVTTINWPTSTLSLSPTLGLRLNSLTNMLGTGIKK